MSLEDKIEALTAARDRNTAALAGAPSGEAQAARGRGRPSNAEKAAQAAAATPGASATASPASQTAAANASPAALAQTSAPAAAAASSPTIAPTSNGQVFTQAQGAEALTKIATELGRDAAIASLDHFGAKKLQDVKPEHMGAFINYCDQTIAKAKNPAPAGVAGLI
jgi:hypothetical protein